MSEGPNFAEIQHRIDHCPTDEDAIRMGSTHAAYGWSCNNPPASFSEHQRKLYREAAEKYDGHRG